MKAAIEALLFIGGTPLTVDRFKGIFEDASPEQIEAQLQALKADYAARNAGVMLVEVANGWQLATCPDHAPWIRKFKTVKVSTRLSRPALETLAIIAYKQPITRPEIEAIRGVNIGGIARNLMERRLVKIVGKKDVPGKPILYGTSTEFLQLFGLKDLSALPTLKEFQELEAGEEAMLTQSAGAAEGSEAGETAATEDGPENTAAGDQSSREEPAGAPEVGPEETAAEDQPDQEEPAVTSEASQHG